MVHTSATSILELVTALRRSSSHIGAYQFVVPLNNTKVTQVESGVVDANIMVSTTKNDLEFSLGRLVPFRSSEFRPSYMVLLKDADSMLHNVCSTLITEKEAEDCQLDWHLSESTTQSIFLSIGFQTGQCWPWHKDKTKFKHHKLLLGEAEFHYRDEESVKLPIRQMIVLETTKLHTVFQPSALRVDLIIDSRTDP